MAPTTTRLNRVGIIISTSGRSSGMYAHGPSTSVSTPLNRTTGPIEATVKTTTSTARIRAGTDRRTSSTSAPSATSTSGQPNQVFCSVSPMVFSTASSPAIVSRANVTKATRSSPQLWKTPPCKPR